MTPRPIPSGAGGARWAVAALDHFAAHSGYAAVPEPAPRGGGWRRLYLRDGDAPTLSAVGPEDGSWLSLGVEFSCPRGALEKGAVGLLRALSGYEVAVDLDAGAERLGPDAVLRIALRLFVEGLNANVVRDAVANLVEASSEARRVCGV